MIRHIAIAALGVLALGGCEGPAEKAPDNRTVEANAAVEDNAAEANAVLGNADAGDNVQARVLAMPDSQRNIVMVRAIMDAELPCDGVVKSDRIDDVNYQPTWKATCKNGDSHIVSITADGIANIVSRTRRR